MVDIISEEKKFTDEAEELFSSSADDGRESESKANSQQWGQPSSKPVHRRTWSNLRLAQKSSFRKVGLRNRAVSDSNYRNSLHQRSRTLTPTNRSHYVPATPHVDENINKDALAAVRDFRPVLDDLGEQINKIEQRFDKQLGAFHKRFEKMEKMQVTILAYIQKLSTVQQNTPGTEIPQGLISEGI